MRMSRPSGLALGAALAFGVALAQAVTLRVANQGDSTSILRRDTSFYLLGWTPGTYDAHNVQLPDNFMPFKWVTVKPAP